MDLRRIVAYYFLYNQGRHSRFMKKSGSCVAQTMKGEGVFVPGFFLRCSILFLIPFPGKRRIPFNEAAGEEDFPEFVGQGG